MRERKTSEWIVKGVGSFISTRVMTLYPPGYNINIFPTKTGIPRSLQLSPILFLFYYSNLVDTCNIPTAPASCSSFVDNMNTLAFSKSTEDNCKML
jgi:hypothetical protein